MIRYCIKLQEVENRLCSPNHERKVFDFSAALDEYGFRNDYKYIPSVMEVEALQKPKWVILVGDAGIGKTYEMEQWQKRIGEQHSQLLYLAYYLTSDQKLQSDLQKGFSKQYLILDGFDEAPALAGALCLYLKDCPAAVHVILTSRWIPELNALKALFQNQMFFMLPLSQKDVRDLANEQSGNRGEDFLQEVIHKGLGSICAKPLECNMLIQEFQDGKLAEAKNEQLWEEAIQFLCAENASATGSLKKFKIEPGKVLDYAAKIALILKLAGESIICGRAATLPATSGMDFSPFGAPDFAMDEFNQILGRALFVPLGDNRYRFAHSSYWEYLTAFGMTKFIPEKLWAAIMLSPDRNAIYPQWEGVAGWLSMFNEQWGEQVLKCQPELLLQSDGGISKYGSDKICLGLLQRAPKMDDSMRDNAVLRSRLSKLKCEAIVPILCDCLQQPQSPQELDMALNIIGECQIKTLEPVLVRKFSDMNEKTKVRWNCGLALSKFASKQSRLDCKAVLAQKDSPDSLKHLLFYLMWPDQISLQEMLPHCLTKEGKIKNEFGSWIGCNLLESLPKLSEEKCKECLLGITAIEHQSHDLDLGRLERQLFTLCWMKYDSPEVEVLLAKTYLHLKDHFITPIETEPDNILHNNIVYTYEQWLESSNKRYAIASIILSMPGRTVQDVTFGAYALLQDSDLAQIIQLLNQERDIAKQHQWAACIYALQWGMNSTELQQEWDRLLPNFPAELKQPAEDILKMHQEAKRKAEENERKFQNQQKQRELIQQQRVDDAVTLIKKGLAQQENSPGYDNLAWWLWETNRNGDLDYRQAYGWERLTPEEHKRFVAAADQYLHATSTRTLNTEELYPSILWSFYMLFEEDRQSFLKIPETIVVEMLPFLFRWIEHGQKDVPIPMFQQMAKMYSETWNQAFFKLIRSKAQEMPIFSDDIMRALTMPGMWQKLIEVSSEPNFLDNGRYALLTQLRRIAANDVDDLINEVYFRDANSWSSYGKQMILLALEVKPIIANAIIREILQNEIWGMEWLEEAMNMTSCLTGGLASLFHASCLENLKNLYIFLRKKYLPENEPNHDGEAYCPNFFDHIYDFKRMIFDLIGDSSDANLVIVLKEIQTVFPQDVWLADCILQAQRKMLRMNCPRYEAPKIINILHASAQEAIVNSAHDLLQVIIGILHDYQMYLQDDMQPQIFCLWNELPEGERIHKSEQEFSDHLASYLRMRLGNIQPIIINREVQVKKGGDAEQGEQLDIFVEAKASQGQQNIKLCIEVKGSWNSGVKSSMESQLVHRYLKTPEIGAGIYLVGWFETNVPGKDRNQWPNLEAARKDLEAQATRLRKEQPELAAMVLDCSYKKASKDKKSGKKADTSR